MEQIDALIVALRAAKATDREDLKAQLVSLCKGPEGAAARERLDAARKGELLEIQWEIEEVLEATAPPKKEAPKPPEAPKPEEKPDPNKPLSAKDLTLVYDDPRGLMLHKSKVGERWFATQFDPRSGQPQTFELHPQEIAQLKAQLQGSPYWVIGSGVAQAAAPKPAPPRPGGR